MGVSIKRLLATLEISRPHNMIVVGGCVYASYYLTGGRGFGPVALPLIFTAIVTGFGNLVNDFFDRDIDGVNKPRRPIPSGRLSPGFVMRAYTVGTAVTTLLAVLLLPVPLMSLVLSWEAILFVYAAKAKRVALLGNLLIGAVAASALFVGAMVTGVYGVVIFPACFTFVFVISRELVKGAEDVEGDRLSGASTLAVRFGATNAAYWGAILLCICAVAAPLPGLAQYFGRFYTVLFQLVVVPGILASAYLVLRYPRRAIYHRVSWILKIEMVCGIIAIGLGRSSL